MWPKVAACGGNWEEDVPGWHHCLRNTGVPELVSDPNRIGVVQPGGLEYYAYTRFRVILTQPRPITPWDTPDGRLRCSTSSPAFDDYCLVLGWPEPSEGAALPWEIVPWQRKEGL